MTMTISYHVLLDNFYIEYRVRCRVLTLRGATFDELHFKPMLAETVCPPVGLLRPK